MEPPTRTPFRTPHEFEDPEALALRSLAARVQRLHRRVALACVLGGFVVGALGVLCLREGQFAVFGRASPLVTAGLGFGLPLAASLVAMRVVSEAMVDAYLPDWIEELSARHGVPSAVLAESARFYR